MGSASDGCFVWWDSHSTLDRLDFHTRRTQLGRGRAIRIPLIPGPISRPPPSLKSAESTSKSLLLDVLPNPVELEILGPGQSARREISVRNSSSRPVAVERIDTTCPCIQVSPGSFAVGAGETRFLTVRFDPSHDPEFRGGLSVVVTGFDESERAIFCTRVDLEIIGAP
ncbi:MAG: DUF1573 domain-containing protein [Isosphaeraceae bacterium]